MCSVPEPPYRKTYTNMISYGLYWSYAYLVILDNGLGQIYLKDK